MNSFKRSLIGSYTLCLLMLISAGSAQAFRFVVYSDCRAPKVDWTTKPFPYNLFNIDVLGYINDQVVNLDPQPDFVMFIGDMINNNDPLPETPNNLQYWKTYMETGLNGIPLYVAVGNSDLYGSTWWLEYPLQAEFATTFSNMPNNGPSTPVDFRHLVYSFEYGEGQEKSLFVVLDSFGIYKDASITPDTKYCDNDFDPYPFPAEQIEWFSAQAAASDAHHKFVIAHGPAFSVIGFPVGRNVKKILDVALTNNFDTFFCAHEHLFYRWNVDEETYPTTTKKIVQNLTGCAGAVPDSATNVAENPDQRIYFGYNFVIVDVESNLITERAYAVFSNGSGYKTELIDTTTIVK